MQDENFVCKFLEKKLGYCNSKTNYLITRCPWCGDSNKHKYHGHLYLYKDTGTFFCFRCNKYGRIEDLLSKLKISNKSDIYKAFKNIFNANNNMRRAFTITPFNLTDSESDLIDNKNDDGFQVKQYSINTLQDKISLDILNKKSNSITMRCNQKILYIIIDELYFYYVKDNILSKLNNKVFYMYDILMYLYNRYNLNNHKDSNIKIISNTLKFIVNLITNKEFSLVEFKDFTDLYNIVKMSIVHTINNNNNELSLLELIKTEIKNIDERLLDIPIFDLLMIFKLVIDFKYIVFDRFKPMLNKQNYTIFDYIEDNITEYFFDGPKQKDLSKIFAFLTSDEFSSYLKQLLRITISNPFLFNPFELRDFTLNNSNDNTLFNDILIRNVEQFVSLYDSTDVYSKFFYRDRKKYVLNLSNIFRFLLSNIFFGMHSLHSLTDINVYFVMYSKFFDFNTNRPALFIYDGIMMRANYDKKFKLFQPKLSSFIKKHSKQEFHINSGISNFTVFFEIHDIHGNKTIRNDIHELYARIYDNNNNYAIIVTFGEGVFDIINPSINKIINSYIEKILNTNKEIDSIIDIRISLYGKINATSVERAIKQFLSIDNILTNNYCIEKHNINFYKDSDYNTLLLLLDKDIIKNRFELNKLTSSIKHNVFINKLFRNKIYLYNKLDKDFCSLFVSEEQIRF